MPLAVPLFSLRRNIIHPNCWRNRASVQTDQHSSNRIDSFRQSHLTGLRFTTVLLPKQLLEENPTD
jgi:hypothetical protein